MRLRRIGIIGLVFWGLTGSPDQEALAQTRVMTERDSLPKPVLVPPRPQPRPKPIRMEWSLGLRLKSDGWALFFDKGWVKSEDRNRDYFYNTRFLLLELEEVRHPKEIKRTNNLLPGSTDKPRQFIFGKINNLYSVKAGYGFRRMIAGKPEPKHVSIHWTYGGGLSLALLKPYYLKLIMPAGDVQEVKYADSLAETFLRRRNIIGGAGFGKGLDEISLVPGLFLRTGLHFDFAATKTTKLALETGVTGSLYSRPLEIMAFQEASPFTLSLYASLQFGKRRQ